MSTLWNCAPEGCSVKHNCRNSEMESCVEAFAAAAWRVGGTGRSGPVCVRTSLVGPSGICELTELSGDCGLGTEREGAVPFDSCVRDKGCAVGVEHAPACNCWRQCSAENTRITRVIPPCGAVPSENRKVTEANTERVMQQRAVMCAGGKM